MRLILVRHPTPQVTSGTCYGRSNVAVAPHEMATVRARLQATLPAGVPLYTSPLRRCAGLATALAQDLPPTALHLAARLAEMDFGAWEMQPWHAIARADIEA